jgi:hypothetical protein
MITVDPGWVWTPGKVPTVTGPLSEAEKSPVSWWAIGGGVAAAFALMWLWKR